MSRPLTLGACAALLMLAFAGPAFGDDGFAPFWKGFKAALAADDGATVGSMVRYPLIFGGEDVSAAGFGKVYPTLFRSKIRTCMAKAKPQYLEDGDGIGYIVFCDKMLYIFRKDGGAWKFAELGNDD